MGYWWLWLFCRIRGLDQNCEVRRNGMKQPKIKIFDGVYDVVSVDFKNGVVTKVVYETSKSQTRTVFKGEEIINNSLTSSRKIQKPTQHPYHDYAYAPDLESLLTT